MNKKTKYDKKPNICKFCNKKIPYAKRYNKFCNSSCAASFNNKGIRRNSSLGTRPDRKCLSCGKITKNSKYCCLKCCFNYIRKVKLDKMKDSNSIFIKSDKKYLIEVRGNECEMCGTKEWLGKPILLIADHIDGNSDNNLLDNIRLICSNCDATLDTYKNRNKDRGRDSKRRKYRQERYKNGSCN